MEIFESVMALRRSGPISSLTWRFSLSLKVRMPALWRHNECLDHKNLIKNISYSPTDDNGESNNLSLCLLVCVMKEDYFFLLISLFEDHSGKTFLSLIEKKVKVNNRSFPSTGHQLFIKACGVTIEGSGLFSTTHQTLFLFVGVNIFL